MSPQLVIGCFSEVHRALSDRGWDASSTEFNQFDLISAYPVDCRKVVRSFIGDGIDAEYYHRSPFRDAGPAFAFTAIGRLGDRSDIDQLRSLSRVYKFARGAIAAIKSIEAI